MIERTFQDISEGEVSQTDQQSFLVGWVGHGSQSDERRGAGFKNSMIGLPGVRLAAAAKRSHGLRHTREATFAKLHASEMVCKVTDSAPQIHGGCGYSRDMDLERCVRDARIARIFDGSSEIHRNIIIRMIMAEHD